MSNSSILGKLRDLQVLVLNPEGEVSDSLVLQLIRIGCPVRHLWPLPETLDFPVDIIFSGVFQDSSHARLKKIIRDSTDAVTLIFIVEYASPSTLSQLLEIESHGVVTVPLKSHDVLPSLVVARRNSEDLLKSRKEINKAHNKLSSMSLLNKAKVILMKNTPMTEEEAHQFLSKSAMEERKSIAEIAEMIIDKSE
ncbi:ANTAR domain-containing response regulator [Vreelandella alkaliphila]|uniref:ANTAR domain-containing response regulator n=1 Tax=Vreelandella alkaliphila TaxID=272774 RepID=UPI003FD8EA56